jgi:hypothetical protein
MVLPPLYKYLDVNGATKTLGNKTFRLAKPSTFEDTGDTTARSVFPEDVELALAKLSGSCVDVIVENAGAAPTCGPEQANMIRELQSLFRGDPRRAEAVRARIKELKIFDVEHMRAVSDDFVKETNNFLQGYRVLCVSSDNASEGMWEDYADDHQGILLRIEPNVEKDSKYQLFRPVTYQRARPTIYDQTVGFLKDVWFGDPAARSRAILDKIIYTKTLPYKFETEYRFAMPFGQEGDWEPASYYPEELTALYLGMAMDNADKSEIIAKAKAVNSKVAIFQADRDSNHKLVFKRA